jgi:hypothetical protein
MTLSRPTLGFLVVLILGCGGNEDPMSAADKRYTRIMVNLAAADRDSTRNIRNREAQKRKVAAENARTEFFTSRTFKNAFAEAEHSEFPGAQAKREAYRRHKLIASSWTKEEKKEEARLLSRLDELNGVEATWASPDGKTEVKLNTGWRHVSKEADVLSEADREALSASYIEHRMRVVGADLQTLIKLRNGVARRAGFSNYLELGLASQGITTAEVDSVIDELTAIVQPLARTTERTIAAAAKANGVANTFANRMMLRRKLGLEASRDTADGYFDADLAEERVKTAFRDMGIPTNGWQVYSGPSRYTRSGVYGFPVRPPSSVAIVMSNDRRWTIWQYEAIAHEGGHAIWWQGISDETAKSPPMWEPTSPWFEGFAQFFERLVYEPGFHARYVPELPKEQREPLAQWRARSVTSSIISSIIQTQVERRLYEDPNSLEAITRFAADARTALTGASPAPTTESGLTYSSSLLSAILWTYPAYSQNYLFSAMTEAWMWAAINAELGDPIGNPKVGDLLKAKLIRAKTDLPTSLATMSTPSRAAALRAYLEAAHVGAEK